MEPASATLDRQVQSGAVAPRVEHLLRFLDSSEFLPESAPVALRIGRTLLAHFSEQINNVLDQTLEREEAKAFSDSALEYANQRLTQWLTKTTVFEVNLAREQARLHGDTGEARMISFVELLQSSEFQRELINRNSLLFSRIDNHLKSFSDFLGGVTTRLQRRRKDLDASFGELGEVVEVEIGKGDSHFGARQVLILRFEHGALVFKPRSLAVDLFYEDLINRVNPNLRFTLKAPCSLDDGDAGWQELVASGTGEGQLAAERFYYSIGAHMALMHLINVSDVHFDNLLTTPSGAPIFFDLETAFSNMVDPDTAKIQRTNFHAVLSQLKALSRCVLTTGILPSYSSQHSGLSALTEVDGRETLTDIDHVVDNGTDKVRLERKRARFEIRSILPHVDDTPTRPASYVDTLTEGFEESYRWLLSHREELVDWIDKHGSIEVRAVLRNTSLYGMFLTESLHPRFGNDESALRAMLGKLAIGTEFQPQLANVVQEEIDQLFRLDVPAFRCRLNQSKLNGYKSSEISYYGHSALDHVRNNIAEFSDGDLCFQRDLIRRMLGVTSVPKGPWKAKGPQETASDSVLLSLIDFLRRTATESKRDGSVSWLNLNVPEEGGEILPVTPTLYSGLAGIFHLFSSIERTSNLLDDASLVGRMREMVQLDAETLSREQGNPGFFNGLAGLLFVLMHDAIGRGDTATVKSVIQMTSALDIDGFEGKVDLIDGLSGTVLFLCSALERTGEEAVRPILASMAEKLLKRCADGFAWSEGHGQFLGGFAHGASGIAHALFAAGHVLGRDSLADRARAALEFEDDRFEDEHENWPDLRIGTSAVFNQTWCNGRPGYLIPRALWWEKLSPAMQKRTERALQRQLQATSYDDDSLCHGSAGGLDATVTLRQAMPDQVTQQDLERAVRTITSRNQLRSGSIDCDAPGLMSGAAGFGYALLRARTPSLPSVLNIYR